VNTPTPGAFLFNIGQYQKYLAQKRRATQV
jgi:hypothetical protein